MTRGFREFQLGPEALEYIKKCLAQGKTLAGHLLRRRDLATGEVSTFFPSEVSTEQVKEFTFGGKLPTPPAETHKFFTAKDGSQYKAIPIPNTDFWLVGAVQDFLRGREEAICVFEDALARPGDRSLSALDTNVWAFNDEVYHFLTHADLEDTKIEAVIRRAMSVFPPLIGVLSSASRLTDLAVRTREVTSGKLKTLAENAEKIIVGAYDAEGYLIWHRPKTFRQDRAR